MIATMGARSLAWIFACGCSFSGNTATSKDAPSDGTKTDAAVDAIDAKVFLDAALVCDPVKCVTMAMGVCLPNGHCEITHAGNGSVTCPEGLYCDIKCLGTALSCIDGVDCSMAIGCNVTCGAGGATGTSPGDNSCSDGIGVRCPTTGPCNVTCSGENACRNRGVTCGNGKCDVHCLGINACDLGVHCNTSLDCTAECQGENACRNAGVDCGAGSCTVECNGTNACQSGKCLGTPTACDFSCCGTNACSSAQAVCAGCTRDTSCTN